MLARARSRESTPARREMPAPVSNELKAPRAVISADGAVESADCAAVGWREKAGGDAPVQRRLLFAFFGATAIISGECNFAPRRSTLLPVRGTCREIKSFALAI